MTTDFSFLFKIYKLIPFVRCPRLRWSRKGEGGHLRDGSGSGSLSDSLLPSSFLFFVQVLSKVNPRLPSFIVLIIFCFLCLFFYFFVLTFPMQNFEGLLVEKFEKNCTKTSKVERRGYSGRN